MFAKPEGQDDTRLALFGEELPEIPATERLPELWRELGYARDGMSGVTPFEWAEIEAFNRLTAADLAPCEASCLVEMSRAYCVEIVNRNPLRKSPMERT
jgi:hypothetical protein